MRDTFSCMTKQQEKSPCCRGGIRRFGGRRRQCIECKKTWRVWKAKQGRRRLRISSDIAHRFVLHRSLPTRAPRSGVFQSRNERQYRLACARRRCVMTCPWPYVEKAGQLIAVADALVKYAAGAWHTWYFILVRAVNANEAVILPPYHRRGTETSTGWREAFEAVDVFTRNRIVALVSDGHRGLTYEAKRRGWLIQRCHFHLISRIQSRRSKWKTSQHYEEGMRLFILVKRVLTEKDEPNLQQAINELKEAGRQTPSRDLRSTLLGFVNSYREFRTYLHHPHFGLPTTNNTAEAMIGLVEEASSRARGFARVATIHEWIVCVVKTRKTIRCAPGNQPN